MVKVIRLNYLSSSLTGIYSLKPLLASLREGDKKQKKWTKYGYKSAKSTLSVLSNCWCYVSPGFTEAINIPVLRNQLIIRKYRHYAVAKSLNPIVSPGEKSESMPNAFSNKILFRKRLIISIYYNCNKKTKNQKYISEDTFSIVITRDKKTTNEEIINTNHLFSHPIKPLGPTKEIHHQRIHSGCQRWRKTHQR